MAAPLEGIRVLDFSRLIIGPLCTMILGDMGADVLMIEDPRGRSAAAGWYDQRADEKRLAYAALHRNKRSIGLDLKQESAREVLRRLARKADVVVDEFRPGVMQRLGADYDTLKKANPRIVCCSLTGYGQDGPYRDVPGFDPNWLAVSGFLSTFGSPTGDYVLPGVPVGDFTCSMFGVAGIMMALYTREKTGLGQFVDVAATDALAYWVGARHWPLYLATGMKPLRGRRLSSIYRTKDGRHMAFSFGIKVFWESFCKVAGLEKYIEYWADRGASELVDFLPDAERIKGRIREVEDAVQKAMLARTRDEWIPLFKAADVCFSPVYEMEETIADPHMRHRQMVVEVDRPGGRKVKQIGIPIKMSANAGSIRLPAPRVGEHTDATLREQGYSPKEIQALKQSGAAG